MKLNKKAKSVIAVYAIILVVYMIAFLILPFRKIAASWISFVFSAVSVAASFLICAYAFKDGKGKLVSRVYGYPVLRIGFVYATAQIIIGILICALGAFVNVPYWVALLIAIILLAAAAIGVIATDNARDIIEDIDDDTIESIRKVSTFKINIAGIIDRCKNNEVRHDLEQLGEAFRFSDPVSSPATESIEAQITADLDDLKTLVASGTTDEIREKITDITNTLKERNRICKVSKI